MKKRLPLIILASAVLLSLALHFEIFGCDIIGYHVWRQTQTQTVIDNFCRQDFCIFNPRVNNLAYPDGIMRTEFPLYQWMIACVVKVTGCPALPAARVFTFVTGVFSMLGFYLLANAIFRNKLAAALGAWAFLFSPVLYYYTVNPLPDNLALCFGIYALYFFVSWFNSGKNTHLYLYAIFLSLATLTKLPFILFGTPFLILLLKKKLTLSQALTFVLILVPPIVWYASVIDTWIDKGIVFGVMNGGYDFITYLDYIQHNFISSIPELLINYAALALFAYGAFRVIRNADKLRQGLVLYIFMSLLAVILYVLFELNMIAKVHDYYLFPLLPFLFLITLYGFLKMKQAPKQFFRVLAFVCMLATPVTAYLRCHTRWNREHPGFNANLLTHKNEIRNLLPPNAICLTGNDDSGFINLYYLNRKGYIFYADMIGVPMLEDYRKKGVTHVVSDALLGDDVRAFLKTPVAVFGDITIYKLN